jgi:hypothetical protein
MFHIVPILAFLMKSITMFIVPPRCPRLEAAEAEPIPPD